jgi:hypothetical protein
MSSQKKHSWVLIGCVIILFLVIVFKPEYGWRLRTWLDPTEGLAYEQAQAGNPSLVAQNETLQAQVAQLGTIAAQIPQNQHTAIRAMVYLEYPFGFKNELLVNAGADQGVAVGDSVTFGGIFIGIVSSVSKNTAVVQTVFDPNFKMPVRIGGGGGSAAGAVTVSSYDALLVGGADPKATSIAKNIAVGMGDVIYTAAPGLPYGLPIGLTNATSASPDNLFQEASVSFVYDVNTIQTVLINP